MGNASKLRVLLFLALCLAALLVLIALLFLAEAGVSLLGELKRQSPWLRYAVIGLFGLASGGLGWVLFRILKPSKTKQKSPSRGMSPEQFGEQLKSAQAQGIDVSSVEAELRELGVRRSAGDLTLALIGEVSVGKSSLVKALLPDAEVEVSALGGSTQAVQRYLWENQAGSRIVISDLPGLNAAKGGPESLSLDEALRCHVVVFLVQGDLSRSEFDALTDLSEAGKPVILALNKVDGYTQDEQRLLIKSLATRMESLFPSELCAVVSISTDASDLDELRLALQRLIQTDVDLLEALRDSAVFKLADRKLSQVRSDHAYTAGQELVRRYTKRAVVGALAAVAPGTDILIQGYLGTNLVKELCETFDAPVQDLDVKRFLEICEQHVGRATPMVLAIAGNGFKAFPGIGTLAGGLIHAAAYGLIFDSLGKSLLETLYRQGTLETLQATALFKEKLSEDLEKRSKQFARLALTEKEGPNPDS